MKIKQEDKKIILGVSIISLMLVFAACAGPFNSENGVKKTGKTIDITEKHEGIVFAKPGDVLLVRLEGGDKEEFQWSFKQPLTGNILSLEKHDFDYTQNTEEFITNWELKIEKEAAFEILFHYETPGVTEEPSRVFRAFIVSDEKENNAKNIYVVEPRPDETFDTTLNLLGYARVFEATVNYRLRSGGKILTKGFVQAKQGAPEYGIFIKKLEFEAPDTETGTLEVFQISAKDGEEIDIIEIPVTFKQ